MPNSNFGLLNKLKITYTDKLETDGYKKKYLIVFIKTQINLLYKKGPDSEKPNPHHPRLYFTFD
jgi:hypothetical protein